MEIKLKKDLTLLSVFCINAGAMMSSGLFVLPGLAHGKAGPAVIISYFLAGLLTIPGMLSQAELSTAMPKAGGTYYYITRSMGPAIGTIYGLLTWFALALKSSFALVGMTAFTLLVLNMEAHLISAILCVIFIIINIIGSKGTSRVQVVLVLTILLGLMVYITAGIPMVESKHLLPFNPKGLNGILSTAGFVFVSYGGLLNIASVAEEVKDPGRVLPLAMFYSLIVVSIFYIMVIFVTTGTLDSATLDGSLTPISEGAFSILGYWGKIALSIIAILAFSSACNAGIMSASRYPMALSRDSLLPEFFGKINHKFRTPHVSILITGIFIICSLFLQLDTLVKSASSVIILTYMFTCAAIIILRESKIQNYQPKFISPCYPWIQIVGIVGCGSLLYSIGREALMVSLIFMACGLMIFLVYGRSKTKRDYAILHLIERLTNKALAGQSLEAELKEVIRERDEIVKDRFDKIIELCTILDVEDSLTIEQFFNLAAREIAVSLKTNPNIVFNLLMARENESSTAITSELAIPHLVIEEGHTFKIFIARCKAGVNFSKAAPNVHAIFILLGTKDERNFHLQALSAVVQIVQDHHFDQKWMEAKNIEALRNIVLLGKRKRHLKK